MGHPVYIIFVDIRFNLETTFTFIFPRILPLAPENFYKLADLHASHFQVQGSRKKTVFLLFEPFTKKY